jgi:hypothetical protein
MNDRQRELIDALGNLGPGEELPAHLRYDPAPEQRIVDEWATELGELIVEGIRDPVAFVCDDSKLQRRTELIRLLERVGDEYDH